MSFHSSLTSKSSVDDDGDVDYDDDESTYLHSAVASDVTFCGQPD